MYADAGMLGQNFYFDLYFCVAMTAFISWAIYEFVFRQKKNIKLIDKLLQPPYFSKTNKTVSNENLIMKFYATETEFTGVKEEMECTVYNYYRYFNFAAENNYRYSALYEKKNSNLPHIIVWKKSIIFRSFYIPENFKYVDVSKYESFDKKFSVMSDDAVKARDYIKPVVSFIEDYGQLVVMEVKKDKILIASSEFATFKTEPKIRTLLDNTSKIASSIYDYNVLHLKEKKTRK